MLAQSTAGLRLTRTPTRTTPTGRALRLVGESATAARAVQAVDTLARWTQARYATVAEALPGGRKSLGAARYKADRAVQGTYHPRVADLLELATCGAPEAHVLALVDELRDRIAGEYRAREAVSPLTVVQTAKTVAKETGEAMTALATAAITDDDADHEAALKEIVEARVALTQAQDTVMRRRFRRTWLAQRLAGEVTPQGAP